MNELCICNYGLTNTGLPLCQKLQKVVKKVIFTQLYSNAGVQNKINSAQTLNKAWIDGMLNFVDKSKRLFPTPEIKNVDTPKGEPVFETYEDGSKFFVSENVRTFTGLIPNCPPAYKAVLESVRCNQNTGVYLVDLDDNLIGLSGPTAGYLYPIPISVQSLVAKVVFATDKATQAIMLEFEFPKFVADADITFIPGKKFTDFSMQSISGLLNAQISFSTIAADSVIATIYIPSPVLGEKVMVEGLVAADFISSVTGDPSEIRDITTGADVAVTGVTETSPGVYEIDFTNTAATDFIVFCLLNGYDFDALKNSSFTTP